MAKKNRSGLQTDITTLLPSGGSGILASNHRTVEENLKDSQFNLNDDDSGDIIYETGNIQTLKEKIEALEQSITQSTKTLRKGYVNIGNGFDLPNGSNLTVGGSDITAVVSSSNNADTLITVNFTTALTNSDYKVNPVFVSLSANFDFDNDLAAIVVRNKTASSFQLGFRNFAVATRNIRVDIEVNEFVL